MAATQELLLGEGAGGPAVYVEDVFSTNIYTGNGATNTITNNIDLSTKGGLVWIKNRSATSNYILVDTVRGASSGISSNLTDAASTPFGFSSFSSTGFVLSNNYPNVNETGIYYASWSFREQPKFFDVVTYTGTGVARTVSHNLGSVPGCIMIKQTSASGQNWRVYHRSLDTTGSDQAVSLNLASSAGGGSGSYWNYTNPTSSVFTVGTDDSVNANGQTYVAYIYAHDAGGFGLTGADNVISCGSYTGSASAPFPNINLGYEPQWLLIKNITSSGNNWVVVDSMRGFTMQLVDPFLYPNTTAAETNSNGSPNPTSTGFTFGNADTYTTDAGKTYIYIAIRRGPMRVPTDGTKVFEPITTTAANYAVSTLQQADLGVFKKKSDSTTYPNWLWGDRLRGFTGSSAQLLNSNNTAAEYASTNDTVTSSIYQGGSEIGNSKIYGGGAGSGSDGPTLYAFKRAPGFFDEVCYTGTGTVTTQTHNLTVVPELMISKVRSAVEPWQVWTSYYSYLAGTAPSDNCTAVLNNSNAFDGYSESGSINALPTASVFSLGTQVVWNGVGKTAVMYLFASCPGVSKVGKYTGTGATLTVNCGFTGGARWVMIKRLDSTGDWWVWDTARGMVAGTDPRLALDLTSVETNSNWVYTTSVGFQVVSTDATVNANGGSYLYLAIA